VLLIALVSAAGVAPGLTEPASAGELGLAGALALLVVLLLGGGPGTRHHRGSDRAGFAA
jgi:hypothetical protein